MIELTPAHSRERSRARCTCHRDLNCPRCTPTNYTRDGAKHRKTVAADQLRYETTNLTPPVTR